MTEDLNSDYADRLELLDRIDERVPELDLDQHPIEWTEMPDGAPGLAIDGRDDGGNGYVYVNYREDLHAIGPTRRCSPAASAASRSTRMATAA